jgi:hypothetical protein
MRRQSTLPHRAARVRAVAALDEQPDGLHGSGRQATISAKENNRRGRPGIAGSGQSSVVVEATEGWRIPPKIGG